MILSQIYLNHYRIWDRKLIRFRTELLFFAKSLHSILADETIIFQHIDLTLRPCAWAVTA